MYSSFCFNFAGFLYIEELKIECLLVMFSVAGCRKIHDEHVSYVELFDLNSKFVLVQ